MHLRKSPSLRESGSRVGGQTDGGGDGVDARGWIVISCSSPVARGRRGGERARRSCRGLWGSGRNADQARGWIILFEQRIHCFFYEMKSLGADSAVWILDNCFSHFYVTAGAVLWVSPNPKT